MSGLLRGALSKLSESSTQITGIDPYQDFHGASPESQRALSIWVSL